MWDLWIKAKRTDFWFVKMFTGNRNDLHTFCDKNINKDWYDSKIQKPFKYRTYYKGVCYGRQY